MTGNDLYEQLYHGLVESVRHKCSRPQEGYRRVLYVLATLSGEHVRAYTSSESKLWIPFNVSWFRKTKKEEEEEYDHEEDEHLAGKAWQLPFKIDVKGARSLFIWSLLYF